ncbi:hypothetical protein BJX70DRAFT_79051 [Aspergillus crustosus]
MSASYLGLFSCWSLEIPVDVGGRQHPPQTVASPFSPYSPLATLQLGPVARFTLLLLLLLLRSLVIFSVLF